jgi:hypothetical protein
MSITPANSFSPNDWIGPDPIFWDDAIEWAGRNKVATAQNPAERLVVINQARRGYGLPEFWVSDFQPLFGQPQPDAAFEGAIAAARSRAARAKAEKRAA